MVLNSSQEFSAQPTHLKRQNVPINILLISFENYPEVQIEVEFDILRKKFQLRQHEQSEPFWNFENFQKHSLQHQGKQNQTKNLFSN